MNGMDEIGGYTPQSMAAAAERRYRNAVRLRDGDPADVQVSIAESLCGLLAMQLSRYADEPHDDFDDDDDDYVPSRDDIAMPPPSYPREESDEDRERAWEREHGKAGEPEVVDPYSIHRAMREMREYQNAGTTCPHCDSNPCRCAEIVTAEADNG